MSAAGACSGAPVFDLKVAIATAADGDVIEVPAGKWSGGLVITRGITLRGQGEVVLDGQGRGPLITINAPGAAVTLSGLRFTNGVAISGAAVLFHEGRLTLKDCQFENCFAPNHGGGAVYGRGDTLWVERCRFERNTGRQGGAMLLDQLIIATIRDSLFVGNTAVRGGAIRLKEGARAELSGCTLVDNLHVGATDGGATFDLCGTATRVPRLDVALCVWSGAQQSELGRSNLYPGEVSFTTNLLPPQLSALQGDNHFGPAELTGGCHLRAGSWAASAAPPGVFGTRTDLEGLPRTAALGAFALCAEFPFIRPIPG